MVQHHVADYEVWRKAYDGFAEHPEGGSVTRESVYRVEADDPNNVLTIMHGFATTADAEKFLAGAELRDAMQQAGVQGQPRVESCRTPGPEGPEGRCPVPAPGWPGSALRVSAAQPRRGVTQLDPQQKSWRESSYFARRSGRLRPPNPGRRNPG